MSKVLEGDKSLLIQKEVPKAEQFYACKSCPLSYNCVISYAKSDKTYDNSYIKQIGTSGMRGKSRVPKSNPLEIIPTLRQRDEGDENTRLNLSNPFLGLFIFLHKNDRLSSAADRGRGSFPTRKPLESGLHLFPPNPRRRIGTAGGPPIGPVKPFGHRTGLRTSTVGVVI